MESILRKEFFMEDEYNSLQIAREVARRAGFTIKDVRIIMAYLKQVIFELLADDIQVKWSGFFTARIKKRTAHTAWNPIENKWNDIPEMKAIRMKASISMTRWLNGRYKSGERRPKDE